MENESLESKLERLDNFLKDKLVELKNFRYNNFLGGHPGDARYSWKAGQREAYQNCQDELYFAFSKLKKQAKKAGE